MAIKKSRERREMFRAVVPAFLLLPAVLINSLKEGTYQFMALVAVMQEVDLVGCLLKRHKVMSVSNGTKKYKMTEELDFLANVLLISVSPEKLYKGSPFRSLTVRLASGIQAYVFCYENRDAVARLVPGCTYSFEGRLMDNMNYMSLSCTAFFVEPLVLTPEVKKQFPGLVEAS